ncbi:MAG: sensor histidine kinase [Bryobacteraceae bacterium]|nr:sensor histidine kinase [Bryobacteraceae bacterium]
MIRLELAVPAGRMVVESFPPGPWTREKLLGATIRVSAVCLTYFNVRGETLGVHFLVGNPDHIIVEKPAPVDPFAVPEVPLNALQPFSPTGPNLERVQIVGQVTLSRPGEYFYLEDRARAVRVFTREKTRFKPGEWVVASGFIDLHQSFAELREADVRRTGPGNLAEPPLLTHTGLLSSSERKWGYPVPVDYNGRLITLTASLAKIEPTDGGGRRLLLSTDAGSVVATLDAGGGAKELDALLPGSGIQVTGVCELQFPGTQLLTDFPNPTGFSLQMRSPADMRVVYSASWWTAKRLWILLGSTVVLLSLAIVWNLLLRRLVRQRSSQLAAETRARDRVEIEYDATLRERTRLAADLHDTLEQALTGLAFQLDTSRVLSAKAPEASARHLELGRQLLTRSREDLRRSIWNLRARALEDNSFADAVREAAFQAAEGRPITIAVEEEGEPCPLPEFIAGNLLLLAQEAMTNAIKHGHAETVTVRVGYAEGWITLGIHDDGRGFDPRSAPGLQEGHFGLQGMRERANRLDGTVKIESKPGKGATIAVRVPIPVQSDKPPEKREPAGAGGANL